MENRLQKIRTLLKERDRKATLKHLNDLTDDKQIDWLQLTSKMFQNSAKLKIRDLQRLEEKFKDFRDQADHW